MRVKVTVNDHNKILRQRGLNKGGKVQQFFGNEIARRSDKYVPLRMGPLKNTRQVLRNGAEIHYIQPYARRQWNSTRKPGSATGPLRGPKWAFRMWAAEGQEIKKGVAALSGGRVD